MLQLEQKLHAHDEIWKSIQSITEYIILYGMRYYS